MIFSCHTYCESALKAHRPLNQLPFSRGTAEVFATRSVFFCPWLSLWDWVRGTAPRRCCNWHWLSVSSISTPSRQIRPQPLSCPQAPTQPSASPEKPHSLFTRRVSQAPWQGPTFPYSGSAFWLLWYTHISRQVKYTFIIARFLSAHTFAGALKTFLLQEKTKKIFSPTMHTETVSSQNIFYAPHHNKSLCSENSSGKKPSQCALL